MLCADIYLLQHICVLHQSLKVRERELKQLSERREWLQSYYGTNMLLEHSFPPTERLNWNMWTSHFLLISKREREKLKKPQYFPSGQAVLVEEAIWGRRKGGRRMPKQIFLGRKCMGSAVQQRPRCETTWLQRSAKNTAAWPPASAAHCKLVL